MPHSFVRLQERDFQETPRCANGVEHSEVELGAPGPASLRATGSVSNGVPWSPCELLRMQRACSSSNEQSL